MAVQAVIGQAFTFQTLFVDVANNPVAVTNPVIDIFSFSSTGVKNPLVTAGVMVPAVPAEVGRYTYVYTIPGSFTDDTPLYAEASATSAGQTYLLSYELVLIGTRDSSSSLSGGLIPRLVK